MLRCVAVIAAVVIFDACKDEPAGTPVVAPVAVTAAGPLPAPAPPAPRPFPPDVVADLALLPDDAEVVASIDLREATASAAWKVLVEPQIVPLRAHLTELQARCGADPLATATRATLGARGVERGTLEVLAVIHGVDVAALRTCLAKLAPGETVTADGSVAVRTVNHVTTAFYFVDDHTLLVEAPRGSREGVVAMAARRSQLATRHRDRLATLDPDATVWAMKLARGGAASQPFGDIFGSAELAEGVAVDVRVQMSSMQEATQSANVLRMQLVQSAFADRLDVEAVGADLRFKVVMTKAKVRMAAAQANGLLELGLE